MKIFDKLMLTATMLAGVLSIAGQNNRIDLSGKWKSSLGEVTLPGSLLTNHLGDDVDANTKWTCSIYDSSYYYSPYMAPYRKKGNIKFPFFLTPDKHYVGTVTYQHSVVIPKEWRKKRVILYLERPHIETTLNVNGQNAGHEMSLDTPHRYDITPYIKFGVANDLSIAVYNGIDNVCVGRDSHSVTDQTQGNWNGIVGRIELLTLPAGTHEIDAENPLKIRVYSDLSNGKVKVTINEQTYEQTIDHPQAWSEFTPVLYTRIFNYHGMKIPVRFGFRDITIKGRQFYLNGNPIWLRGTVENCDFPLTGYPPTDVASWITIIKKCKDYGLNAMRFHSYCPPEAAFIAADSLGFYLQPEGPSWPNHGVKLRRGMKIDQYLMDETKRIVDEYGNHPSFVMMAAGNEPAGDWVTWCNQWVDTMKVYDSRRVYCGASVGGGWAWDSNSQYHVKGGARGLDWDKSAPQSKDDYLTDILYPRNFKPTALHPENDSPYISHEQGQWCAFPDLDERSQYTGVYKAKNFDIFADLLRKNGMESMARHFLMASGHLQVLAYKYEIERNLRTPDYAGFFLLGLNDYSGQGTALVGPLNVFWREKGYVRAEQWRQFCSPVVPLAEFPKFVYSNKEQLSIPAEVYNASDRTLKDARCTYYIHDAENNEYAHGLLVEKDIPQGKDIRLGILNFNLSTFTKPVKLTLTIFVDPKEDNELVNGRISNQWDFWVYPETVEMPAAKDIYIADSLDARAMKILKEGGKVLLQAAGKVRYGDDVRQTYLPVFWNTSWFKMRPPHTTGIYVHKDHPLFKEFPTDGWSNLNWWELVNKAQVMNLSEFPADYQSPVQPIDTWHVSRKLGMLVEAKVLKGRLLMTTMDITRDLDHRLVARQMRKAILDYMESDDFRPSIIVDSSVIKDLYDKEAPAVNMFTRDSPDELKPKIVQ